MASPYGHALVGLGLFKLWYPRLVASRMKFLIFYGLVVLGALVPDLDFLPGLFLGNLSCFHHGLFHSLGTAVGLSLIVGFLMAFFRWNSSFLKTSGFVFILIISHLLLDFFTEDPKPPFGFPVFWLFSEVYFISPWPILPHVERNFSSPEFGSQIIHVFLFESLFFLPFLFFPLKGRILRKKKG